jgi:hypothetical protein
MGRAMRRVSAAEVVAAAAVAVAVAVAARAALVVPTVPTVAVRALVSLTLALVEAAARCHSAPSVRLAALEPCTRSSRALLGHTPGARVLHC